MRKSLLILFSFVVLGALAVPAARILRMTDQGEIRFYEDSASGSNFMTLRGNATQAGDTTLTLPADDGNASEVLETNGSGVLSWVAATAGTLDAAYNGGSAITVDTAAIALSTSTANTMLTLNQTGAVSTDVMTIANAGTGKSLSVTTGVSQFDTNVFFKGGIPWRDVRAFGATGDGTTDDRANIQTAISAMSVGDVLVFPPGDYKILGELDITTAQTSYIGFGQATITQGTASEPGIEITAANDVHIEGLRFIGVFGTGATTIDDAERAIHFIGTSAAAPLSRGVVRNCFIQGWGGYGVRMNFSDEMRITNNRIDNIHFAGVMAFSGIGGLVSDNHISNINGTTAQNAYGVSLTRVTTDSIVTDPLPENWVVDGNVIVGVPEWEGLDTHGGQSVTFSNNVLKNCHHGIAVTRATMLTGGVETWAPKNVTIAGNTIDSTVTDGSRGEGIIFSGAGAVVGSPVDLATGSIVGNYIYRHGTETGTAGNGSGGILALKTLGLVISGNSFREPSPYGISMAFDNYDFSITGNTFIDPWTSVASSGTGIEFRSDFHHGHISGNIFGKDSKVATSVGATCVDITIGTNTTIQVGNNFNNGFDNYLTGVGVDAGQVSSRVGETLTLHGVNIGDVNLDFEQFAVQKAFLSYRDAGDEFLIDADGDIVFQPANVEAARFNSGLGKDALAFGTGTDTGLTIGGDTTLYRSAANTLKTDDALSVASTLTADGNFVANGFIKRGTETAVSIAAGVLTITKSVVEMDTEADAATDDLDTISNASTGNIVVLYTQDGARDVTIRDGTGNITMNDGFDVTLTLVRQRIAFIAVGTGWFELFRSF